MAGMNDIRVTVKKNSEKHTFWVKEYEAYYGRCILCLKLRIQKSKKIICRN